MRNCFEVIAIRVQQKSSIVVWCVALTQTGFSLALILLEIVIGPGVILMAIPRVFPNINPVLSMLTFRVQEGFA